MIKPYTPELRTKDADIALAMGWRAINRTVERPRGRKPDSNYFTQIPFFHRSEKARAALLDWLAADDAQWQRFEWVFYGDHLPSFDGMDTGEMVRAAFLATPAQVAEAAWQAIQEGKKNDR